MSVDVRYPCYYPTSLQQEKLLIMIMYCNPHLKRLLFAELAFVGSAPANIIFKKSDSTSIRFHFDNFFIT